MEKQQKLTSEEIIPGEVLSNEEMVDVSGGQTTGSNGDTIVCSKCGNSFPESDMRDGLCHDCWFRSPQHGFGILSIPKPPIRR